TKDRVIPYVEDRRNVLVLRLAQQVDEHDDTALALLYALERGIEATFQLEDSELTGELLPDTDHHGRMRFIESAEGGAGVLRRLVEEPDALAAVATKALEIAHFDPVTGEDLGAHLRDEAEQQARCVQACYDCLLSYSNQPSHTRIDRHRAVGLLRDLAAARAVTVGWRPVSPPVATNGLAGEFVSWLRAAGYRTPDEAGQPVAGTSAVPDL